MTDYNVNYFCFPAKRSANWSSLGGVRRIQAGHLAGSATARVTMFSLTLCPCFIQIIPGRLSKPGTGQPIPVLSSALQRGPPGRPHLQHRQIPQQAVLLFLSPGRRRRHHRRGDPVRRETRTPGDPAGFSHHHCRRHLHFPAGPARTET